MNGGNTTIELPWSNIEDVIFASGENINFSTINEKILRLLDNDLKIYNTKRAIDYMPITTYDELFAANDEISSNTTIWHNYETTSLGNSPRINILFPLHKNVTIKGRRDEPSTLSEAFSTFVPSTSSVDDYSIILDELSAHVINQKGKTSKLLGNIIRADLAYHLCQQDDPSAAFKTFYDKGYRWGELLLSEDCLTHLSCFTDNVHAPFLKFTDNNSVSSSVSGTIDTGILIQADQSILKDTDQKLMNGYPTGSYIKEYGSGWAKQGGISQISLAATSTTSFTGLEIKFDRPFSELFNIHVQAYTNYIPTELNSQASTAVSFCPAYVEKSDLTSFTVRLQPCYSNRNLSQNSSKKYQSFNLVWEAEGLL